MFFTENLGHQTNAGAQERPLNQQYTVPPTESNVTNTSRFQTPSSGFPMNPRPTKKLKTLNDVEDTSQTGSSSGINESGTSHGTLPIHVEPESRSKARKSSRPVKNVQETEHGPEIIRPVVDEIMVKTEATDSDNHTDSSRFTDYGVNWMSDVHKVGSVTYLSKPSYDQGMLH